MSATCLAKTTYSLRRIFFWMILVAGLSSLVTYHIGLLLPRLEINQSVNYVDVKVRLNSVLVKEVNLEKTGIDNRRSQHLYRKLSQASDSKIQNSQLSQILAKLKQVSLIHFLTESYRRLLILRYKPSCISHILAKLKHVSQIHIIANNFPRLLILKYKALSYHKYW